MKLSALFAQTADSHLFGDSEFGLDVSLIRYVSPELWDIDVPYSNPSEIINGYETFKPSQIVAVVLTRDEEEGILRCMEGLAADVDRYLIIDSGSIDSTIELALDCQMDVAVVSEPWIDDFSHHRNIAFDHVSDGWLCYVDADEVLAAEHAGRLRRVLHALEFLFAKEDIAISPIISDVDGPSYTNTQRIVGASGLLRFRGRVHEHPYTIEGNAPPRVEVDVEFAHYGYLPETVERMGKADRHERLIKLCLESEPDNPKWEFYRAREILARKPCSIETVQTAISRLKDVTWDEIPAGVCDYQRERVVDSWALLCELALRTGETDILLNYSAMLDEAGRKIEAKYYRVLLESSRMLSRLSHIVDEIGSVTALEDIETRHLVARLLELQSMLALSSGRYELVIPACRKALERGAGLEVSAEFDKIRQILVATDGADDCQAP